MKSEKYFSITQNYSYVNRKLRTREILEVKSSSQITSNSLKSKIN